MPIIIEDINFPEELQPLNLFTIQYIVYDKSQFQTKSLILDILRQMVESVFSQRRRTIILSRTENLPNYRLFQEKYDNIPIENQILGNPSDAQQFECDIFMIMPSQNHSPLFIRKR